MEDLSERVIRALSELALQGEAEITGVEFARFVSRLAPSEPAGAVFGAYLVSAALEESHTCLRIDRKPDFAGMAMEVAESMGIDMEMIRRDIFRSASVGRPGQRRPMILHDNMLYIHRYWSYEKKLAELLTARSGGELPDEYRAAALDIVNRLFPERAPGGPDWQKLAVLSALHSGLLVISGGPGTGKTRTVTAIMAALVELDMLMNDTDGLVICMCAPTGKAASRLGESVASASAELDLAARVVEAMPSRAHTIHRLLGSGNVPGSFRFNSENPLPCDVVIVDEASMVDLPLMAHLVEALSPSARLVLLGDRDQLASVEAGCVLRDICMGEKLCSYSDAFVKRALEAGEKVEPGRGGDACPLRDSMITLEYNYRFRDSSGIDELAAAVNRGDFQEVRDILVSDRFSHVNFVSDRDMRLSRLLDESAGEFAGRLLNAASPEEAIDSMEGMKILCGVRHGGAGVKNINSYVGERFFMAAGMKIYRGMPVIINRNDYRLELFNGDTGIIWPDASGTLKAWFRFGKDDMRSYAVSRLPAFETAWAVTVHRSQGSEFRRALIVLPPESGRMPGRELLYTAITRAREGVTVWGSWNGLRACVETPARRDSGLGMMLWEASGQ